MHFHALSQQPNTKIQILNLILDQQKKIDINNQSIHQHKHPFLMPHHNIHNPLNLLLVPITISITNENNQNYSQQPTLLKSPNQPQFLNLDPHVSLVYQVEER